MEHDQSFGTGLRELGLTMSRRHPAASLNRRYLAALFCIAGLIVLDQVLIQPELARLTSDAPVINVSGRQRMLSQRLSKTALVLAQHPTPDERTARHQELTSVLDLWTRSHHGLQAGDDEQQLPGRNPAVVLAAFARIEPHFQAIRDAAADLLTATAGSEDADPQRVEQDVASILTHEPAFLKEMDQLVGIYEAETRQHVRQLERTSWTIAIAVLATMWVLHMIAIRPATQLLERRYVETQDQYLAVIESINEGLLRLDAQGRILFANRQFSLLAGRKPQDLHGIVAATLFQSPKLTAWPTESHATSPGEMELRRPNGELRTCWVSPCPLTDRTDKTTGWVVLVMDVTEQRASELRAQSLSDQLHHADRLKSMGEIAAGLAHEVNQPLGAISNFAEGCLARIASSHCSPEELEAPLRRILRAALRAGGIIRRVKQFSQKRPHTIAMAEMNALVEEAVELFSSEIQRRRVRCDLRLSDSPLPMECDALQISQVLTNLLQNCLHALDANAADDRVVTVETAREHDDSIRVTVSDNGPGFAPEILGRLFEPFSTSRPDGLGMGLSIVRSIVEAHGGVISAANGFRGGMVTIVCPSRLPAAPKDSGARTEPAHAG